MDKSYFRHHIHTYTISALTISWEAATILHTIHTASLPVDRIDLGRMYGSCLPCYAQLRAVPACHAVHRN